MVNSAQAVANCTATNGFQNGRGETSSGHFLFTSESVGEGHPGNSEFLSFRILKFYSICSVKSFNLNLLSNRLMTN